MDIVLNIDLLSVGIAIAGTLVLGFSTYFSDPKSITKKTLFYFSIITALWGFFNYISYQLPSADLTLWSLRFVVFLAVWQAFFVFQLFHVFPKDGVKFSRWYKYLLIPVTVAISILTLTPLVFRDIADRASVGVTVSTPVTGPGIAFFGIFSVGLVVSSLFLLVRRLWISGGQEKKSLQLLLSGILLMFLGIIVFNFILPSLFSNVRFIPLGALFTFPFVALAAYAIVRHKLFNIKIAGISLLTFLLAIVTFAEIIFANDLSLVLFRSGIFLLVLIIGISLLRGVFKEVKQREQIQTLAAELKDANEQQSELLYFITHQIKGFFTNTKGALSMIMEGDYGPVPEPIAQVVKEVYGRESKGVDMVQGFLNASKIEQGQMEYVMKPFDAKALVTDIVGDQKSAAEAKGLMLETKLEEGDFTITGDRIQLREAFFNLVDNAVRYTPQGTVTVGLEKRDGKTVYWVKDTGVGIDPDDRSKLFTKYGHGKDSRKVNVNSNGIGLYTVKKIIEAHKGRVWVESEGPGKGSTFYIELV